VHSFSYLPYYSIHFILSIHLFINSFIRSFIHSFVVVVVVVFLFIHSRSRNYIVSAMKVSLKEIIRVLQLTTPSEEEGALASSTGATSSSLPGGILPGTFAAKVFEAQALLAKAGKGLVELF